MNPFLLVLTGMALVVVLILALRLHPFLSLMLAALVVAGLTPVGDAETLFVSRVMADFGKGVGKIGFVIAMAAIVGVCLLESGAAEKIVETLCRWFGEKRTPVAFSASAFTLGIPVYFDTVFYLMIPLARSLRARTGRNYLLYVLAVVAGGTMAHSLVPPTPGPVLVASELGVDLGVMILAGLVVGLFTVASGYAYALWANRRWDLPMREVEDGGGGGETPEPGGPLPPFWASIFPILLPVILIGGAAVAKAMEYQAMWIRVLGDKNIGLLLAAAAAIALLVLVRRRSQKEVSASVGRALASGGVIILITGAGSAFGATLAATGIGEAIAEADLKLPLLPLAFLITAIMRTAQGSATVAMMTSVGIVGAVVEGGAALDFHPVYLALAIGCGSKPISWANDSGFWVVGRMSGMTPLETFRGMSLMMIVMALTGLAVVMIAAKVLPMV